MGAPWRNECAPVRAAGAQRDGDLERAETRSWHRPAADEHPPLTGTRS